MPHNYGQSQCWMGKSTISMAIFNSELVVYQRVIWYPQWWKHTVFSRRIIYKNAMVHSYIATGKPCHPPFLSKSATRLTETISLTVVYPCCLVFWHVLSNATANGRTKQSIRLSIGYHTNSNWVGQNWVSFPNGGTTPFFNQDPGAVFRNQGPTSCRGSGYRAEELKIIPEMVFRPWPVTIRWSLMILSPPMFVLSQLYYKWRCPKLGVPPRICWMVKTEKKNNEIGW